MRKQKCTLVMLLVLTAVPAFAADPLYELFKNPPAQARPFVRWWWNGGCVTEAEVVREIEIMHQAGIGGFEMNTIAMPAGTTDAAAKNCKPLKWLSPDWNKVVKAGAIAAKKRGMIPDLIVGSGWPFGGRFLKSGEQIQIITVNKKKLSGPGTFESTSKKLAEAAIALSGGRRRQRIEAGSEPRLVFLRLVPDGLTEFQLGTELSDRVKPDGSVKFDIPAGDYILYAGAWREGYRTVSRGAPGADGPVVDHLNKAAVEKYLSRMSDDLNPVFDGKMGSYLRAMFCDSLELGHTNWTGDFAEQFKKRRGYSLDEYLPFMVDLDPVKGDSPFADTVRRLRYDFNVTVIELFMERFMTTFTEWCHANGVKSRVQAYGRESQPLDTSFLVDIPECETWIRDANKTPYPTMINRYVASAAHLMGKTEVSCEAMTNTVTVFRTLPENIKRTDDLNFITGVTHSVLHGFNYTPLEAGFPGWVQFGCYFNEKNPWWPYFRKWADYNARISAVLQASYAQANVAVLSPDADIWSSLGRLYLPFPEIEKPWYIWEIWKALHQNGYNVEYTSDSVLAQAKFEGGKIRVGPRAYDAIILEDVETILPQTAKRLAEYAKAGGKIIFVRKAPYRSPSFKNAEQDDKIVRDAVAEAMAANPDYVAVVEPPTKETIVKWAGRIMDRFGVEPDVRISSPNANLSQIHHKIADRDIYFFAWSDMQNSIDFTAQFPDTGSIPWQWDPETASSFPYPVKADTPNKLHIHLEPLESLLLVFQPGRTTGLKVTKPRTDDKKCVPIKAKWQAEFVHAVTHEKFTIPMTKLSDISKSDDKKLSAFAGTITYTASFNVADNSFKMLDLGAVYGVSEVTLNDKNLGVRWYGRHTYYTAAALKPGDNTLKVKVTTNLGNYVRTFKRDTAAGRWAWWYPSEPMGMLGPIRLCKTK